MKDADSRALWDLKYEQGLPSLTKPDPFFLSAYEQFVHPSFSNGGLALDLAGGTGRHALWLANRKWNVTVVDVSRVAIKQLRHAANDSMVELNLCEVGAAQYDFGAKRFDLIVLFYYLDRSLFPKIISALNVGGFVICKLAVSWGSEIEAGGDQPLSRGELVSLFSELEAIDHRERPVRDRGVVEFVGQKSP